MLNVFRSVDKLSQKKASLRLICQKKYTIYLFYVFRQYTYKWFLALSVQSVLSLSLLVISNLIYVYSYVLEGPGTIIVSAILKIVYRHVTLFFESVRVAEKNLFAIFKSYVGKGRGTSKTSNLILICLNYFYLPPKGVPDIGI